MSRSYYSSINASSNCYWETHRHECCLDTTLNYVHLNKRFTHGQLFILWGPHRSEAFVWQIIGKHLHITRHQNFFDGMRAQNRLIIAQCYTWIRVLWLVHIAATSSRNYCNVFYVGLPLKHTQQLHLGLNGAAHLLAGNACDMHTECRYSSLHWVPRGFQVQCKVLILSIWGLCTCPADDSGIGKRGLGKYLPSGGCLLLLIFWAAAIIQLLWTLLRGWLCLLHS